jgi:crossover junction endodeoxyribonuclease RuvC
VLGIDPGSRVTGYGVVDIHADALGLVDCGVIRLDAMPLAARLARIHERLLEVVHRLAPDDVAVERVFVARNARSALTLGHARGVAILVGAQNRLPINEYSAREIKLAVVGTGTAHKSQVQHMIRALLGMDHTPPADAADALACAICHGHTAVLNRRLSTAEAGA